MILTRNRLFAGLGSLWVAFMALNWFSQNSFQVLNIVGFSALIACLAVPSYLALRIRRQPLWLAIGMGTGFALLELVTGILLANTIMPHLGVPRPLDPKPLLFELAGLFMLIVAATWHRLRDFRLVVHLRGVRPGPVTLFSLIAPIIFVAMSIFGAITLNNGGNGGITLSMLIAMTAYLGWLLWAQKKLSDSTIATAIYLLGLSLLFMTSLRGWLITGHDIQREYHVFELAKNAGVWDISKLRDPYNACLSITILPTIFANALKIGDPYVYKVLFQLLFAVVPTVIYIFTRTYANKIMALLATIYFLAFPTFFSDMPMLNRQEMAFLFLSLMLAVVFSRNIPRGMRQVLFLVFGLGMVLSHYSTTYSFIAILLVAIALRPLLVWIVKKLKGKRHFTNSGLEAFHDVSQKNESESARTMARKTDISILTVLILAAISFTWNTLLTQTSNSATVVVEQVATSILGGFNDDAKSTDTSYSLLNFKKPEPQQELNGYVKNIVQPARQQSGTGVYYSDSIVNKYPLRTAPANTLSLTGLGKWFSTHGVNVARFNYLVKQASAKLLQVFVFAGVVYVIFRRRLAALAPTDFALITAGSVTFVLAQVALPLLSVEYGLLRAFQQSLMVLGLFVVMGTYAIGAFFRKRLLRQGLPIAIGLLFFVVSTSTFAQLLGGYSPQLHLNNSGQYYDVYYIHASEVNGLDWLSNQLSADGQQANTVQTEVQTDRYAFTKLQALTDLQAQNDITPGLVRKNAYVFLGFTDETKREATVSYNNDLITYSYPMQFLNDNKDLIYNNGGSEIYR